MELKTLELWISGSMLNLIFLLILQIFQSSVCIQKVVSKIQLIRVVYAESRTANQKPGNFIFSAPSNERALIGRNLVGISKKEGKRAD